MKLRFLPIALAIFAGTLASCSKQDDDLNNISGSGSIGADRAMAATVSGSYTVEEYLVNGMDHTTDLRGTRLMFFDHNVMYATGQGTSFRGEWGIDQNANIMKMRIDGSDVLRTLSGSYVIASNTYSQVILKSNDDPANSRRVVLKKVVIRPRAITHHIQ